jgi:thiol-disulfide isomerase/thioredoxin
MTLITISSVAGAVSVSEENYENEPLNDFTHTVFAEYASTTWCPYCPAASQDMYSIYQSGDYPLFYVSLISDMNSIAKERMRWLRVHAIPAVYFDGGYLNIVGAVGESAYRLEIEESGQRTVKQPLGMNTSVTWNGNAKITVKVEITNDGNFFYLGILRSYVTEIVSRWKDNDQNPYHFGFLDFAIRKFVFIRPGKTATISKTWDGAKDHGGQTFEDITEDNILVVSTVAHWLPHIEQNDDDKDFLAFYVDQTSAATP